MNDRAPPSRPRRSGRRPPCAPAAVVLAGWLVLAPLGGFTREALGQEAKPPPGASEPRPESKVPKRPSQAAPAPAGERDADGQGVAVADGVETGMRAAFAQLADADFDVREAARLRLMALERRYLPALQKLVARSRPLLPAQAAVMRQIVTHVYLAGEPYNANGNLGFLGVRMLDADLTQDVPARPDPGEEVDPGEFEGGEIDPREFDPREFDPREVGPDGRPGSDVPKAVLISERMPGFAGHRALLDGDLIIGFTDRPDFVFRNGREFGEVVRQLGAGRTVRFTVLRRGQLATVAVTLDPRPDAADTEGSMADLDYRRRQKAEAYWEESFGRLLGERVG